MSTQGNLERIATALERIANALEIAAVYTYDSDAEPGEPCYALSTLEVAAASLAALAAQGEAARKAQAEPSSVI